MTSKLRPGPLVIFSIAIVATVIACATNETRTVALRGAYTTIALAGETLNAVEHAHTDALIAGATSGSDAREKVAAWRAQTDRGHQLVEFAFQAIALAFTANDQTSSKAALAAVASAVDEVAKLKNTGSNAP